MSVGKELVASNGTTTVVFRFIGRSMFIQGSMTGNAQQVIQQMKAKNALKAVTQSGNWVKIDLIDDISEQDLHETVFNNMVKAYEAAKFTIKTKEI